MKISLLLLITAIGMLSCQKELDFPGGAGAGNSGGSNSATCLTCDYSPMCDSSKFTYVDSTFGVPSEVSYTYDVTADTTVNGVVYKKIKQTNAPQISYFSCADNIFRQYIAFGTGVGGTTISNVTQTALKANEAVGATWTDAINIGSGATAEYRYQIIAKGITRQVLDSIYSNIIYVRDTTVTIVPLIGEIPSGVRHSYWAKGIGLVEVKLEDLLSGSIPLIRKLKSYRL